MQRFRHMRSLQKFASVHSSVYNHFNQENAPLNDMVKLCSCLFRACAVETTLSLTGGTKFATEPYNARAERRFSSCVKEPLLGVNVFWIVPR